MTSQTRLSRCEPSQTDTDATGSAESATTQLTVSDLHILSEKTDAVIDRSTDPYKAGKYENATPVKYVRPIGELLDGFDLDPCASEQSMLAEVSIRNDGGLLFDWGQEGIETVWVNPPYERKLDWLDKSVEADVSTVVMLLPAYTSSTWFQDYAQQASIVCFLNERVAFHGDSDAPFHSVYMVFGEYPTELADYFNRNGYVSKQSLPNGDTINVAQDHIQKLLNDLGRLDRLKIEFPIEDTPSVLNQSTVRVEPICENLIQSDGETPIATTVKQDENAPSGEYIELTCIHKASDGSETFILLGQSVQNPHAVYCCIDSSLGWMPQKINRVRVATDREKTHDSIPHPPRQPTREVGE